MVDMMAGKTHAQDVSVTSAHAPITRDLEQNFPERPSFRVTLPFELEAVQRPIPEMGRHVDRTVYISGESMTHQWQRGELEG